MDTERLQGNRQVLKGVLAAGKELGFDLQVLDLKPPPGEERQETHLRLHFGEHETTYSAEIRRALRPATLGAVILRLRALEGRSLLLSDYVTPPLAERLRKNEIEFIDTAGNAFLKGPGLLVWVKGQRPRETGKGPGEGRAFQPRGLQVVFALLCEPESIDASYREIARRAGVAHGTVGWVIPELQRMGHLAVVKRKRRLLKPIDLLEKWVEAYARTLRPNLVLGRFETEGLDWLENLDLENYDLLVGGEPAANLLTGYLRPGSATLYGRENEPRFVLDKQLRPDNNGRIEILRKFWNFDAQDPRLTPTLLVYADLLAMGDARCIEAARILYDERIAHRFVRLS